MTEKALQFAEKPSIQLVVFTVAALLARIDGISFVSSDMKNFLFLWFDEISAKGGLHALSSQVGDYGVPYQTIIALFTYLPYSPLLLYKVLSIIFDFILAILAAVLVYKERQGKCFIQPYVAVYGLILLSPLVVWNSSVWGQCDSMYAAFCIASILLYEHGHPYWAFVLFGFAFAFKLQSVFLLPYFGYKILSEDKWHRLAGFCLVPLPLIVLSVPAVLYGRPVAGIFDAYLYQVSEYKAMYANAPSVWAFGANVAFNDQYSYWQACNKYALIIALLVLLLMLIVEVKSEMRKSVRFDGIIVSYLSVHAAVIFLPSMHERYAFLAEILLAVLVVLDSSFVPSLISLWLASIMGYGQFLFGGTYNGLLASVLSVAAFMYSFYLYIDKHGWFQGKRFRLV